MTALFHWWSLAIVALLGVAGAALLVRRVAGTVLIAPLAWGALAWGVLSVTTLAAEAPLAQDAFLAASATFLPAMAVFGAKRPQHRGWQWIVVALWATLVWPALEARVLDRPLEIAAQPLRAWFLVILLGVQWSNWCVTRYLGVVTLATTGQVLLLWPNFPWSAGTSPAWCWPVGYTLLALVPWEIVRIARRGTARVATPPADAWREYDRLWRDFRDALGVVWGLRAMERVNEVARLQHWNVELTWNGFAPPLRQNASGEGTNYDREAVDRVWNNVLRRFVDPRWIRTRLGRELSEDRTDDERDV